jgi:hypothetical protein
MHANVPVRFGRGRLDSLATKGLAAYLIARSRQVSTVTGRSALGASKGVAFETGSSLAETLHWPKGL